MIKTMYLMQTSQVMR